jgi:hypothetical protein
MIFMLANALYFIQLLWSMPQNSDKLKIAAMVLGASLLPVYTAATNGDNYAPFIHPHYFDYSFASAAQFVGFRPELPAKDSSE